MSGYLLCKFFGHKFGEWEYVAQNSCEQVRVCKRDGYEERRKVPHQFGEWEYVADNSCEQVRVCKRDGYEERRYEDENHQFGEWEKLTDSSYEYVQVCEICGKAEYEDYCPKCGDCGGTFGPCDLCGRTPQTT